MKKNTTFCTPIIKVKHPLIAFMAATLFMCGSAEAQTNPTAVTPSVTENFGSTTFTSLASNFAAWTVNSSPIGSQGNAESSIASGNASINAATALQTTGGCYGYAASSNGRFYIQTSSNGTNGTNQLITALDATGLGNIVISYDIEMISANARTIGVVLQFRNDTSGSWTTVSGGVYSHTGSDRSNGDIDHYSVTLPQLADNNSVIQVRWAAWRGAQTGNSSGMAIDNISITASSFQSNYYFRSKQNGNWNSASTWETSPDNGTWGNASAAPNYLAKTVTIQSADSVSIIATDTIDDVIVNGILAYEDVSGSTPAIYNGTGVDLTINGKFYDGGPNSIVWLGGATWEMGSNGRLIRNRGTSSNNWRDNYHIGIAYIPATSHWIIRKNSSDSPTLSSTNTMYYPNLTIENYTGSTWVTGTASSFTGSLGAPFIKGSLNIGGYGTNTVSFLNSNTSVVPVTIFQELLVRTGNTLRSHGTGFQVEGDIIINGTVDYGSANAAFILSGNQNQTLAGNLNFKNLKLNKAQTNYTVTLQDQATIENNCTFIKGYLITTSSDLLTFGDTSTVSVTNDSSFVKGPVKKIGNTAFTFPLGKNTNYQPIAISAPSNISATYTAEYFQQDAALGSSMEPSLDSVSVCEYWTLNNVGTVYPVSVTVGWNSQSCFITDTSVLRLAQWDGTTWIDLGNSANPFSSSITSDTLVNSFGTFTMARTPHWSICGSEMDGDQYNCCLGSSAGDSCDLLTVCVGTPIQLSALEPGGYDPGTTFSCPGGTYNAIDNTVIYSSVGTYYIELLDGLGNNHATGIVTITPGTAPWPKAPPGTSGDGVASNIARDNVGNTYIAGYYSGTTTFGCCTPLTSVGNNTIYVAKYNDCEDLVWVREAVNSASSWGEAMGVAVDNSGNVYITGDFQGTVNFGGGNTLTASPYYYSTGLVTFVRDIFIAKYDVDGNILDAVVAGGQSDDFANDIAVDNSGNLYITGTSGSDTNPADFGGQSYTGYVWGEFFLAKYSSSNLSTGVWVKDAAGADSHGNALILDNNGNIDVTGVFSGTSNFGGLSSALTSFGFKDMFLTQYSAGGTAQWAIQGGGTADDRGEDVFADANGNVYVSGKFESSTASINGQSISIIDPTNHDNEHFVAVCSATNGTVAWVKVSGGTSAAFMGGAPIPPHTNVTADVIGNVYVAATFSTSADFGSLGTLTSAGSHELYIVKYDNSGSEQWVMQTGNGMFSYVHTPANEAFTGIVLDASTGLLYTSGFYMGTVLFGSTSVSSSSGTYNSNIFAARLEDYVTYGDFRQYTIPVEASSSLAQSVREISIYPNPTAGNVMLLNEQDETAVIEVTDMLGRVLIRQLILRSGESFTFDISDQARGLYFVKIKINTTLQVRKINKLQNYKLNTVCQIKESLSFSLSYQKLRGGRMWCLYCSFIYFFFSVVFSFAQKENNIWHFGQNAGLDFNSGAPVAFASSSINQLLGSASICDSAGNLLFYTDGVTVWNKNNIPMPNGDSLMGHMASSQSALIIKQPGNDSIYYIFTTDYRFNFPSNRGFRYSIVNMALQGSFGDVVQKNVLLFAPASQQQTAVKHCNNRDVWIVAHEWDTTVFHSYLLTDTGLSTSINSYVGLGNTQSNKDGIYLKPSPYGNKIAQIIGNGSTLTLQIFNFSRNTGQLQLFAALAVGGQAIEFSPDGEKLYLATAAVFPGINSICQYNLLAGSSIDIVNSQVQVGVVSNSCLALQIGADGKIYAARYNKDSLGVVNFPNQLGVGCNYVDNGVSLANKVCKYGLPNFYYIYPSVPIIISEFSYSDTLYGDTTFFSIPHTAYIDSVRWNFDDNIAADNTSGFFQPYHVFSSERTYNVQVIVYYPCNTDTIYKTISITKPLGIINVEFPNIYISPNPTSGTILIRNNGNETAKIEISDVRGRVIAHQLLIKQNENVTLDVSEQPAGLYLLKTKVNGTTRVYKLLKQ